MSAWNQPIWGALAMACWVAGLFFLRFWQKSKDRIFVFFFLAMWVFGLNWAGLAIVDPGIETRHWFYVIRLVAFVLIIAGIIDKNSRGSRT